MLDFFIFILVSIILSSIGAWWFIFIADKILNFIVNTVEKIKNKISEFENKLYIDNCEFIKIIREPINLKKPINFSIEKDITEKAFLNTQKFNPYNVKVGQIWLSLDSKNKEFTYKRVIELTLTRAICQGIRNGKIISKSKISLDRFKNCSNGYVLVENPKYILEELKNAKHSN